MSKGNIPFNITLEIHIDTKLNKYIENLILYIGNLIIWTECETAYSINLA